MAKEGEFIIRATVDFYKDVSIDDYIYVNIDSKVKVNL